MTGQIEGFRNFLRASQHFVVILPGDVARQACFHADNIFAILRDRIARGIHIGASKIHRVALR
jgi:hypothetical protein